MSLTKFRQDFREALLSFIWRQWAQAGVSGHAAKKDSWTIDPEALLLLSAEVGRYEARMFDEVLDWLLTNARRISLQRLKNLLKSDPEYPTGLLASIGDCIQAYDPAVRWTFASDRDGTQKKEPLFMLQDGKPLLVSGEPDPHFARHGYLRTSYKPSNKSMLPVLSKPFNIAFRLRQFFGVNSRAEVVRVLMLHRGGELKIATIADAAGFAKRNVNEALTGLAEAGVIQVRCRGKENLYAMHPAHWLELLELREKDLPEWLDWPKLFRTFSLIHRWQDNVTRRELSLYMQSSEARQLMRRLAPDLSGALPGLRLTDDRLYQGEDYLRVFVNDTERILRRLA